MNLQISLSYNTRWGERIVLVMGKDVYEMTCSDNGRWSVALENQPLEGSYGFELRCDSRVLRVEAKGHSYKARRGVRELVIIDRWNDVSQEEPFKTAFFSDVIFRRGKKKAGPAAKGNVTINVCAPSIRPDETLGITGEFCGWGTPIEMGSGSFPMWSVNLQGGKPFEYKFVIISSDGQLTWETGRNRFFAGCTDVKGAHTVVNDYEPIFDKSRWRGAGVAVPVFSLRTEEGFGIGEFLDLKKMVDWVVATGQNVIQLLPINDTTMTSTWQDSYPYNANTTFALHPQFINLPAAGVKVDKAYKDLRSELNALPKIDYEKVNGSKDKLLRKAFEGAAGRKVLESEAYKEFLKDNGEWLVPYAVFRCLTAIYGSPDFSRWGKMAKYSKKACQQWAREHESEVAYHCFVQYHLDKQLKEVVAYAHSKGVALKGDLPIGISRTSVDAWVYPELYHLDSQAGAPPDAFSVLGQNWGFPTYNWEKMSEDGFAWWKARMRKMSEYFDAFRIDHILGFFRIWEIPMDAVHGLLGHFNPALPYSGDELAAMGFDVREGRYVTPMLHAWILEDIFGDRAGEVHQNYIRGGKLAPEVSTQRKVLENVQDEFMREGLMRLLDDVLFVEDPRRKGFWHPRISGKDTYAFRCLDNYRKDSFISLHDDFYYRRHNDFWRDSAMFKLPSILSSTGMLTCGEDLGMIPACVPDVMRELGILSLEIQRMPKSVEEEFGNPAAYPYCCVCATGTHDTSNIRAWWEEDREVTSHYWHNMLGRTDEMPWFCEPWVAEMIVRAHLDSPAMLCILPLQDYLAISGDVRYPGDPADERINVPAIPRFYWRYRMHVSIEQLLSDGDFTRKLSGLVADSGRGR